jgi:pyruvate dehydrogenase E1 component alpha subunit
LTFLGEGAFSVGDVHEGLNLAGVWKVPVVFVLQSNGYSYSTPASAQMVNTSLAERIQGGWSIPAERVDGTDAMVVFDAIKVAVERARAGGGPQAVECVTLRGHGHAAHDDASYVPAELRESFAGRDPIERLELRLRQDGLGAEADAIRRDVVDEISAGLAEAETAPAPDPTAMEHGVYAQPL